MARWLAPSAVAACAGTLAAGVLELAGDGDLGGAAGVIATIGFLALLFVPLLLIASLVARGAVAAWQPHKLAERLIEDGGGAPVLAAWGAVIWSGAIGLAAALFQGAWVLANETAWIPLTVSIAMPIIGVVALLGMLVFAWPVARMIAAILRRADALWRRSGRRSLLTPWWILGWLVGGTTTIVVALWFLLIKPRIGPFDLTLFAPPAIAIAVTIAMHVAWRLAPVRVRAWAAAVIAAAACAAVGFALVIARTSPSVTLSIWGDRPLAGLAIDKLYNLDVLRSKISLAELAPTEARPGAAHPDIVLITIDTVRADHTPPYGGKADMPALAQLANTGVVFDWAFSPSNVTRRSIPAMVTGLQSNRVHGRVVGWALRVDPRHVMLAERLKQGGYDTAGFMCCEGFWGGEFHTGLQRGLSHLEIEKNGLALAAKARTWIDEREQTPTHKPLFLWMHVLEPHNWVTGTGEGLSPEDKRRMYDHALSSADAAVVALLAGFSKRPADQQPIVIVTADHGEALGEHGHAFHSTDLYDSQTHVPLIMSGPGIHPGRVGETVSLVDLVPTIMELAGFEVPTGPAIDGRSIADLAQGKRLGDPEGGEAFAAQIRDRSNPGGITAIVRGRYKLVSDNGQLELYDTRNDPAEHVNLAHQASRVKLMSELRARLDKHEAMGDESPFP